MASRVIHISSMLMVFILLIDGSFSRPSMKIASSELEEICSTAQDPSLCVQALNSDPRTAKADLKGLAQISIDLAKANATKTNALIASLVEKATNLELKLRYQSCVKDYDSSIGSLDNCSKSLSSGDYSTLNAQANAAMDGPATCFSYFQGPPDDPAQLSDKCMVMEYFISMVIAISKRLIG